jgi:hypothetical protein
LIEAMAFMTSMLVVLLTQANLFHECHEVIKQVLFNDLAVLPARDLSSLFRAATASGFAPLSRVLLIGTARSSGSRDISVPRSSMFTVSPIGSRCG